MASDQGRQKSHMGKRQEKQQTPDRPRKLLKHPLLVYTNLGRRYRPPAVLLIVMGLFALLPRWIKELRNDNFDSDSVVVVGVVVILAGVGFFLFSMLAKRRAYVLCRPDVFVVRSPFSRTMISYRRIKDIRAVPVKTLYGGYKLKGLSKALVGPLMGSMAVVVIMKSWPRSRTWLRRLHGPHLFSPRQGEEAWVFIVPNYSVLMREIDDYRLRKLDEDRAKQRYEDPIDRLKYYSR